MKPIERRIEKLERYSQSVPEPLVIERWLVGTDMTAVLHGDATQRGLCVPDREGGWRIVREQPVTLRQMGGA